MPSPESYRNTLLNEVSVGYGLMSLTWRDSPVEYKDASKTISRVLASAGGKKSLFNVGEFYGPRLLNYQLLQNYFNENPQAREKVIVSAKGSFDIQTFAPCGDSASVSTSVQAAVDAFGGYVDIYEPARLDHKLVEKNGESIFPRETFDTIVKFIKAGKVGAISLSEVTAEEIRAIHKEYGEYLVGVEVELSLLSTDILENGILDACNELSLPVIAYSPLAKGLLAGSLKDLNNVSKVDPIRFLKRYQDDKFSHNLKIVQFLEQEIIAKRSDKATLSQVAIAWVNSLNARFPNTKIIPIPSGTTVDKVAENFTFISLSETELSKIDEFLKTFTPAGGRTEFINN